MKKAYFLASFDFHEKEWSVKPEVVYVKKGFPHH
jgi:hypothetical protein